MKSTDPGKTAASLLSKLTEQHDDLTLAIVQRQAAFSTLLARDSDLHA